MQRRQLVRMAFAAMATGVLGFVAAAPTWATTTAPNNAGAIAMAHTTTSTCKPDSYDKPCPKPTESKTTPPPTTPPATTPPATTPPATTSPPTTTKTVTTTTSKPPATLPVTGVRTTLLAAAGALLLLGGSLMLMRLRRRSLEN
jgi:LPXTG-motif cell wall-anchored protein